tara:strand:- start:355 stop:555 length:201 start_codon:yes stop_codon:yes gene_type:complete
MKELFDREKNTEERLRFVTYWANYVRTHPDKVWSKQQAVLINAQLQSTRQMTKEQYLAMKSESSPK